MRVLFLPASAPGPACTAGCLNDAEVSITAMLEGHAAQRASDDDTPDDGPGAVPILDDLADLGDPCLRW